jgi:TPR repeat protein
VSDDAELERQAHDAWERGHRVAAFRLYSQLAARGTGAGMLNLGYFYDCGIGVRKNRTLALKWYRRAYRQGSGAAASNIATIYRGEGRRRLEAQWYARAVRLKDGDAAVELAKLVLAGKGIRKSKSYASRLLKHARTARYITEDGRDAARSMLHALKGSPNISLERTRER